MHASNNYKWETFNIQCNKNELNTKKNLKQPKLNFSFK